MSQEFSNSGNTLTLTLAEEAIPVEYDVYGDRITAISGENNNQALVIPASSVPQANVLSASTATSKKVQPALGTKIICYDTETTGTDPWDYRLLGCSFWDLSKPISTMESFFSFDEREVTKQIAAYLNREKPDALVQYNNGFDERALLTRFMLYQEKVPGWNGIQQIDVMDILKKGTTQSISSSQSTGAEEDWLFYFFGEKKPFSIAECFEGIREGSFERLRTRNRTCVESEGALYLLFREVTDAEPLVDVETKPTIVDVEEQAAKGVCLIKCPTCSAVNDVPCKSTGNTCWRCLGSIPDPTESNRIKEIVRQYDFSKVGITSKTTSTTKS